ncbi:transposase [Streptomyces nigrescens]|uniref:transposase n=1 Tax=Streptomyces nigrescens TaxID=1920 RepID=UPI003F4CD9F3
MRRGVLRRAVRGQPCRALLSGNRQYRRLNRGGDRQANAALHRIVQSRLRFDPRTRDYLSAASRRARPGVRQSDASNATLAERSFGRLGRLEIPACE